MLLAHASTVPLPRAADLYQQALRMWEGLQAECHPYVHVLAMLELLQCTSYASLSAVCRMGMPGTMRLHGHRALLDERPHAQRIRAIKATASALAPAQIPRSINGKR